MTPHLRRPARLSSLLACLLPLLCAGGIAPARADTPATGTASAAVLAAQCAACHGPGGRSSGAIPSLDGWGPRALRERLLSLRNTTPSAAATVMPRLMKGMTDAQIDALAQWFGSAAHGGTP